MGLLRKVENIPDIDYYEYRDSEYYNKYRYRAKFRLDGIGLTYFVKSKESFLTRLEAPQYLRPGGMQRKKDILGNIDTLTNYINWRNQYKKPGVATFRVESESASIYSNDLKLLHTLKNIGPVNVKITEVQLEQFAGVKYFVNDPKHKYRIYLKSAYIKEKTFIADLSETIAKSKELVASSALYFWLKEATGKKSSSWRFTYTSSTHSIDYDNESTLSYLMLMYGHMLGKRYKLEKRPEPV